VTCEGWTDAQPVDVTFATREQAMRAAAAGERDAEAGWSRLTSRMWFRVGQPGGGFLLQRVDTAGSARSEVA
jgi:hypothetical protein